MSDVAIQAVELSKKYRIGSNQVYQNTLRDLLADTFRKALSWSGEYLSHPNGGRNDPAAIWALKDVTFEVKRGDVVGIVGHNGAGKSTLLRILSFVTEPTAGHVQVRGRVGSLLEIGTGFHSELTGRENIYLSGAILGMKKSEIDRKFDEIVAFAGVEKFIDTQIKHYSSGMYMRLGFAVAAHLDPEILLVDEVLAVGDADFQKKCIGSIQSVAKSGQTVLVVSHNMAVIESLCKTAMWIDKGRLRSNGNTPDVISAYLTQSQLVGSRNLLDHPRHSLNTIARYASVQLIDETGEENRNIKIGSGITVKLEIKADQPIQKPCIGIQIRTPHNQLLFHIANREAGFELPPIERNCTVSCRIKNLNLLPGRYYVNLILSDLSNYVYDEIPTATFFDVTPADVLGTGMPMGKDNGMIFFATQWEVSEE